MSSGTAQQRKPEQGTIRKLDPEWWLKLLYSYLLTIWLQTESSVLLP